MRPPGLCHPQVTQPGPPPTLLSTPICSVGPFPTTPRGVAVKVTPGSVRENALQARWRVVRLCVRLCVCVQACVCM